MENQSGERRGVVLSGSVQFVSGRGGRLLEQQDGGLSWIREYSIGSGTEGLEEGDSAVLSGGRPEDAERDSAVGVPEVPNIPFSLLVSYFRQERSQVCRRIHSVWIGYKTRSILRGSLRGFGSLGSRDGETRAGSPGVEVCLGYTIHKILLSILDLYDLILDEESRMGSGGLQRGLSGGGGGGGSWLDAMGRAGGGGSRTSLGPDKRANGTFQGGHGRPRACFRPDWRPDTWRRCRWVTLAETWLVTRVRLPWSGTRGVSPTPCAQRSQGRDVLYSQQLCEAGERVWGGPGLVRVLHAGPGGGVWGGEPGHWSEGGGAGQAEAVFEEEEQEHLAVQGDKHRAGQGDIQGGYEQSGSRIPSISSSLSIISDSPCSRNSSSKVSRIPSFGLVFASAGDGDPAVLVCDLLSLVVGLLGCWWGVSGLGLGLSLGLGVGLGLFAGFGAGAGLLSQTGYLVLESLDVYASLCEEILGLDGVDLHDHFILVSVDGDGESLVAALELEGDRGEDVLVGESGGGRQPVDLDLWLGLGGLFGVLVGRERFDVLAGDGVGAVRQGVIFGGVAFRSGLVPDLWRRGRRRGGRVGLGDGVLVVGEALHAPQVQGRRVHIKDVVGDEEAVVVAGVQSVVYLKHLEEEEPLVARDDVSVDGDGDDAFGGLAHVHDLDWDLAAYGGEAGEDGEERVFPQTSNGQDAVIQERGALDPWVAPNHVARYLPL
ncbi:hypothetical protein OJ252_2726 [Cryptosporidium canis]|uniref:Uncharacterized protein n=1 Tax=Cryptosporidium canis TaxID=195482 RepID=A0ABQ8P4E1_9CRYT|nr:hypothetical protein OJ252_2726 [Cryptosporidium canis]